MDLLKTFYKLNRDDKKQDKTIDVPDSKLKEVINKTLGKDRSVDAEITKAEMESIKQIKGDDLLSYLPNEQWTDSRSHDRGIRSLEGLQYATNLESLDLSENGIKDLTPLKDLKKLKYLELDRNMLGDLTPLSNLTSLTHLNIYNNDGIVDTEAISSLTNLEWLDLHWCNRGKQSVNVEPLGRLINLQYLNFESNSIGDISFTKNLKKLTTIGFGVNNITDVSPLSDLIVKAYVDEKAFLGEDEAEYRYVGMLNQSLKDTFSKSLESKQSTFKISDPVKGLQDYMKGMGFEAPEVSFKEKSDKDNNDISLKYNKDTKEIEVMVNENKETTARNIQGTIFVDYGFYSLNIKLNITQSGTSK